VKPSVPALWSFNGGYVDTASYLALHGLFTSHVTGNFVTLGAAIAYGSSGAVAKLLALPTFCLVIVLARALANRLRPSGWPMLESAVLVKIVLLSSAAALAITRGPFPTGDGPMAVTTGMILVAAMAIQNAATRVHLPKAPPTTIMTGTSTQIMLDIADLATGKLTPEARAVVVPRFRAMAVAVISFALGCALAALGFTTFQMKVFLVPPLIAAVSLLAIARGAKKPGAGSPVVKTVDAQLGKDETESHGEQDQGRRGSVGEHG
jgi:uncharacterized membrane protein YoaK (UPF0700 family)